MDFDYEPLEQLDYIDYLSFADNYNLEIAYKCINNKSTIIVTIFNESLDNKSYNFYDDSIYSNKHYIEQYKTILKKIRSKEL